MSKKLPVSRLKWIQKEVLDKHTDRQTDGQTNITKHIISLLRGRQLRSQCLARLIFCLARQTCPCFTRLSYYIHTSCVARDNNVH